MTHVLSPAPLAHCGNCGEENPAHARFCSGCAAPLSALPKHGEVRKTVTVLHCDVTDFTGLGESLDPESLRRVMGRFFEEMQTVLERHGGKVEKFIGDAIMAVFGIPEIHEDDAVRAVRAALEMREALAGLNDELERGWGVRVEMRTGINTGEVVAGTAAGRTLVTGDPVTVASRLEQAAVPGEILLGRETFRLVRDLARVEALEPLELKGKARAVPAYRLLGLLARVPPLARRVRTPLVGREHELELLHRAFGRAVGERTSHLFSVFGPAGVGKSRLVTEFLRGVADEARVLSGTCLPYGEGITFWPVSEVVAAAAGLTKADTPDEARAKIGRLLESEENGAVIAERVAQMIGLLDVTRGGEELFWALRKLLETLARRSPLVVVFDDVHSAEPTFLDLIEHLAEWTRDAPILLLCLARTELFDQRPGWPGGKLNAASILLEPLSESQCDRVIDNLVGKGELGSAVRRRMVEAAGGNPLFLEEMIFMLMDEGLLRRENGSWTATADLSELAIPATIQALLAARLDRLDADERHVIERAAIEGKVFHRDALVALSSDDIHGRLDRVLTGLARRDLIRADPSSFGGEEPFSFRHILIRDAAYQAMPKALRGDLHERFADWRERDVCTARECEELIGYHLEQAHRYRSELSGLDAHARELALRAAGRLASAGRRAFDREDMPAAANMFARAASLYPREDQERLDLLPSLGAALMDLGQLTDAHLVLEEVAALAAERGDARLERRATLERAQMSIDPNRSAAEQIRAEAEQAVRVFEQAGDAQGLSKAWRLVGETHLLRGRGAAAEQALLRAVGHAVEAGDLREKAESQRWLARAMMLGPMPTAEGILRCHAALEMAGDHRVACASTKLILGALLVMRGSVAEGRASIAEGRAVLRDVGLTFRLAQSSFLGRVEILAGSPETAERDLREGYEILERMGERSYYFPLVAGLLAHSLAVQGRSGEALAFSEVSERWTEEGDLLAQILWRRGRARALAERGELGAAEQLVREAVRLAEGTDFLWDRGDALLDLAAVLRAGGEVSGERAATAEAVRLYEEKGISVAAERLRESAAFAP
jgi:class 3 adenylate cyclase/tetratricopeptide (TPR) repeat protein